MTVRTPSILVSALYFLLTCLLSVVSREGHLEENCREQHLGGEQHFILVGDRRFREPSSLLAFFWSFLLQRTLLTDVSAAD